MDHAKFWVNIMTKYFNTENVFSLKCKNFKGPRLEKLMSTYVGKADFAKVDIDQCYDLADKYSVNSVPTVIAMKNGKEVGKFTGLIDEDKIKQFVKTAVGS